MRVGLLIAALLLVSWAFGAVWFNSPGASKTHAPAIVFLLLSLSLMTFSVMGKRWALPAMFASGLWVACWWFFLEPSNERDWQTEVAREPWAEVNGDLVTLHNVRNFDYCQGDETGQKAPVWETRTVRLSDLVGIDAFLNFWGVSWMAHPILSFQFRNVPPVAISIETRKEKGEGYSALGGLYRQFELVYVVADERDVIRVRSNHRQGEDVYLYRTTIPQAEVRERFMEYVRSMNDLHARPRWYNAVTANCTTAVRSQRSIAARSPWDLRILMNGKIDEMFYERGLLVTERLAFPELKRRALINPAARAADADPAFSLRIREGRPGFGE